jgi:uncharacterized protein YjbJ (UPF0337 family)
MPDRRRGLIGSIREKLGWLTADRMEEARGRLEQADAGGVPKQGAKGAADAVDRAELEVRDEYGDLAPEAKPD